MLDLGGGPGHFARAFRARGANCLLVEPDLDELRLRGAPPAGAVRGDGMRLPAADGAVDVSFFGQMLREARSRPTVSVPTSPQFQSFRLPF